MSEEAAETAWDLYREAFETDPPALGNA
jgi:hypothetical protein